MTTAFISGSSAVGALVRGNDVEYVRFGEQGTSVGTIESLDYVFADADDVMRRELATVVELRRDLDIAWAEDRALRLLEIVLDSQIPEGLTREAAEGLDELLRIDDVARFVRHRAYSLPLTRRFEVRISDKLLVGIDAAKAFVYALAKIQPQITRVRDAWERIPDDEFLSVAERNEFELAAIEAGAFYELAISLTLDEAADRALFFCYQALHTHRNYRTIINIWTASFKVERKRRSIHSETTQDPELEAVAYGDNNSNRSVYEVFTNVLKQQEGVIAQLDVGNEPLARRYASELVLMQVRSGDQKYAVKTLCNLAKEASDRGRDSLSLEWLLDAQKIDPEDGWAHGQTGDAYLELYRFEEALREYEKAEKYGDELFGINGRARLLKERGKFDEALQLFSSLTKRFDSHPEIYRSWAGYAEVLRNMFRYEEALAAYAAAVELFDDKVSLRCGHASILADLGRLDEAISEYHEILITYPNEPVALTGLAEALKALGRFDAALGVYKDAILRLPSNLFLVCGRAALLAAMRRFADAKAEYEDIKNKFPNDSGGWVGLAECLMASGSTNLSLDAYVVAMKRFPSDIRVRNGYAKALKIAAKFQESLWQYEKNIREFPYNPAALTGRAALLKELRSYAESIKAYEDIIEKYPSFGAARFGKASALAIVGRFEEALGLLALSDRKTRMRSDWVCLHVRGMIALRQGQLDKAEAIFEDGSAKSQFYDQRSYFASALALVKLKRGDYQQVLKVASDGNRIANVLRMHAYCAIGNRDGALREYKAVNDNEALPLFRELSDAIAVRYKMLDFGKPQTDSWIAEQEEILLLQAA